MADIQTFSALVDSLAKNNDLLQFNCFGDRKGIIHLRAQFTKEGIVFEDIPKVSMRIKSGRQLKRNKYRAAKWRDDDSQISSETPPTDNAIICDQSSPKEILRNESNSEKSPIPNVLDCSIVDNTTHNEKTHSESTMHCEPKQLKESFEVIEATPIPELLIPIQPIPGNQISNQVVPKPSLLPQIKTMFSFNRHHQVASKPTKPSKPTSQHKSSDTRITKETPSAVTPSKPPDELICTDSWCAKGQVTTSCTCTLQAYPCYYCTDSRTIFKKICKACQNRF